MVGFSSSYESYWCGYLATGSRKIQFCLNTVLKNAMTLLQINAVLDVTWYEKKKGKAPTYKQ
jgi:hypothetical protein